MARPLRIHVPDGRYHVMIRGNGGAAIHREDDDRRRFLGLVPGPPERFGTEIHAFVLMDNHYHFLVRCRRADLSETLRWLQTNPWREMSERREIVNSMGLPHCPSIHLHCGLLAR
ncbi:MAG: hypothetical protein DVB31_17430 [Verrucomicrobia bacterium]|nr:MAG: hypothetical protein DVB31_17430 [Verrucomicrobiota bacterium]